MKLATIATCAAAIAASSQASAGEWSGFLGPPRDVRAGDLPTQWSPTEHVAWKTSLPGYGQSSPVVHDGRVYVTSILGPMKETFIVSAWDFADGKQLWVREYPSATPAENSNYVSKAAPSPVVDSQGVIAFSEGGNLVALNHDGTVRWQRNLVEEFGPIAARHGLGSSLAQNDRLAFVWVERGESPYLLAVDKTSGKDVWKVPGLGATSWSTPALVPVDDRQHLVLSASGMLIGFDPETGQRLWTLEGLTGNSTPTPQVVANRRLLLGATEGRGAAKTSAQNCNGLIEITGDAAGGFHADFVWRSKKAMASFGSPIAHEGLVYIVNNTGVLFCLDLETGEERYAHRIAESIWATPIALGDRIYLFGKAGRTTVLQPGDTFEQLAENRLWEAEEEPQAEAERKAADAGERSSGLMTGGRVQYAAIAVDGSFLVRTGDILFCLRN